MDTSQNKYKIYRWTHWMMLHWLINPGLAINELILGQRVPKISYLDTTSSKSRAERSFVPCPHCNTVHDGRTWSTQNGTAFKNWFGLYCPTCEGIIPCLTNGLSFILLLLSSPIWFWFRNRIKKKWLAKQAKRYENLDLDSIPNPFEDWGWIKQGIIWATFMYCFMVFLFPLLEGSDIGLKKALISIPIWLIVGLAYGYTMKVIMNKKGAKLSDSNIS